MVDQFNLLITNLKLKLENSFVFTSLLLEMVTHPNSDENFTEEHEFNSSRKLQFFWTK